MNFGLNPVQEDPVLFREAAHPGGVRGIEVLPDHLHGIHSGEHARHLWLIVQPAKGQRRGCPAIGVLPEQLFSGGGQQIHQPAAPQGFHDNHRQSFAVGIPQAIHARLGAFIHIIVLNLAEIPVIGIHELLKNIGIAMVRKTDITDFPCGHLFFDPLLHPHFPQFLPGWDIRQHVEQVIINVVGLQPFQLLLKGFFHAAQRFN